MIKYNHYLYRVIANKGGQGFGFPELSSLKFEMIMI